MNTRISLKRLRDTDSQSTDSEKIKKLKVVKPTENSVNVDLSDDSDDIHGTTAPKPSELRQAFMPVLEILNAPKSRLGLSTIKRKLSSDEYSQPWEFLDDVESAFEKIWHCNQIGSSVHKYSTELFDVYKHEIDRVMQSLGYCCGQIHKFQPEKLCCSMKEDCTIPIDGNYFIYQTSSFLVCEKCFIDAPGNYLTVDKDTRVKKDQLTPTKNNAQTPEPFIDCQECSRQQHQICVLHSEKIWPSGFVCDSCLRIRGVKRKENRFKAKNLPMTQLDRHIEMRVNSFLAENEVDSNYVHIRMLLHEEKIFEVKPEMRKLFVESGEMSAAFPYRLKAILAFQEIDGVDVCFFGMNVQEYGSECAKPNTRRVSITFLDSVNLYQPKHCRTAVYQQIVLGYMDFAKQLGYVWLHIWACPPPTGENYIFYNHPIGQKIPDSARLQKWYTKILRKGKSDGIIVDYNNILEQSREDNLATAADLPYFYEDHWPYFFEEKIEEILRNDQSVKNVNGRQSTCRRKTKNSITTTSASVAIAKLAQQKLDLKTKLLATMAKFKNLFFSVRLHTAEAAATLDPIQDPDRLMFSSVMSAFFNFARDNNLEFSSLRRARFSTMRILYELHSQGPKFEYACNICETQTENRYHCTVCDDYDLCVDCYETAGHDHKMDQTGFFRVNDISSTDLQPINLDTVMDDTTSPLDVSDDDGTSPTESDTSDKQINLIFKKVFLHASKCQDWNCRWKGCKKIRGGFLHVNSCQKVACEICTQFKELLTFHAIGVRQQQGQGHESSPQQSQQRPPPELQHESSPQLQQQQPLPQIQQQHPQPQIQQQKPQADSILTTVILPVLEVLLNICGNPTDPLAILDSTIGLGHVQIYLQKMLGEINGDVAERLQGNDVPPDSTVPEPK